MRPKRERAAKGLVLAAILFWSWTPVFSQSSGSQTSAKDPAAPAEDHKEKAAQFNSRFGALSASTSSPTEGTVAGSEKTKEAADPAPTRAEVEQLRNEVERLRSLVDSLVKERETTKEAAKEANKSEPQSASKEQNNQSNSIYSTNQSQEKQ